MNTNEVVEFSTDMYNASISAMSQLVYVKQSDGSKMVSQKSLPALLHQNQLGVEQEILLANQITEATIALIASHDLIYQQNQQKQPLLLQLHQKFQEDCANYSTAQESFMGFLGLMHKLEEEYPELNAIGLHVYLSSIFSPTLLYLKSILARQGLFVPEVLNNEMRNGVSFSLFKEPSWTEFAFQGEQAAALYSLYDEDLLPLAMENLPSIIQDRQLNYLYHYLGLVAYQITFGSLNAMESMEMMTGINFGFHAENIKHPNKTNLSLQSYLDEAMQAIQNSRKIQKMMEGFNQVVTGSDEFSEDWQ